MPAALSFDVQQNGVPLGALALSGSPQQVAMNCVNRLNAIVQAIAIDASGNAVDFLFSATASGMQSAVPAGAGVRVPVYKLQSWWFQQGVAGAASIQFTAVG